MKTLAKNMYLVVVMTLIFLCNNSVCAEGSTDKNSLSTNIDDYTQTRYISIKLPNDETIYPLTMYDIPLINNKTGECFAANFTMYRILSIATNSYEISYDKSIDLKDVMYQTGPGLNGSIFDKNNPSKKYTYSSSGENVNSKTFLFKDRAMLNIKDVLDFFGVAYEKVSYDSENSNVVIYLSESNKLQKTSEEKEIINDAIKSMYLKKGISVTLNGKNLEFDVSPVVVNDRVLVPMRAIFEELGATIQWDDQSQTVTAIKDDRVIKLSISSKTAFINNDRVELDVEPQLINGRTMVPIRFISESLGA